MSDCPIIATFCGSAVVNLKCISPIYKLFLFLRISKCYSRYIFFNSLAHYHLFCILMVFWPIFACGSDCGSEVVVNSLPHLIQPAYFTTYILPSLFSDPSSSNFQPASLSTFWPSLTLLDN